MRKLYSCLLSIIAVLVCMVGFFSLHNKNMIEANADTVKSATHIQTTTQYGADWQSSPFGQNGYVILSSTASAVYSNLYTKSGTGYGDTDLITISGWSNAGSEYFKANNKYTDADQSLNLGIDKWAFVGRAWKATTGASVADTLYIPGTKNNTAASFFGWGSMAQLNEPSIVINKVAPEPLYFTTYIYSQTSSAITETCPLDVYVFSSAKMSKPSKNYSTRQDMIAHYGGEDNILIERYEITAGPAYVTLKLEGTGEFQIVLAQNTYDDGSLNKSGKQQLLGGFFLDNEFDEPIKPQYNINYNVGEGKNSQENLWTKVVENTRIYLSDPIPPEGYLFDGWYTTADYVDSSKVGLSYKVKTDVTFYAKYQEIIYYDITYNVGNGQNNAANPSSKVDGESFTLLDPIPPEHHSFEGWYTSEDYQENSKVVETYTISDDVVFYAKYKMLDLANISYVLDGGENALDNPTSYYVYEGVEKLKPALKEGFTFNGWYLDSTFNIELTGIPSNMTGDVTLYALFIKNPIISNIVYVLDGGINAVGNLATYVEGESLSLLNASKENSTFVGWFKDSAFTQPITEITPETTGELTLYAKFIVNDMYYAITYILDGGINATENPDNYSLGETIVLNNPTKDGCKFEGWYLDADYTQKIDEISTTNSGDLILYAKFVPMDDNPQGEPNTGDEGSGCSGNISGCVSMILLASFLGIIVKIKTKKAG